MDNLLKCAAWRLTVTRDIAQFFLGFSKLLFAIIFIVFSLFFYNNSSTLMSSHVMWVLIVSSLPFVVLGLIILLCRRIMLRLDRDLASIGALPLRAEGSA